MGHKCQSAPLNIQALQYFSAMLRVREQETCILYIINYQGGGGPEGKNTDTLKAPGETKVQLNCIFVQS